MGFEQLKYSPPQSAASQQQSMEKHKLISHSKQEDKTPLRSYQFGSLADHLVVSSKARITRCDLSSRFFCIDAELLCEFESDKIWINEFE